MSTFDFKFKFKNLSIIWKRSKHEKCRACRVEQLLCLENFMLLCEFWRKGRKKRTITLLCNIATWPSVAMLIEVLPCLLTADDRRPLAPFPLAWTGSCFAWTRCKQEVDILVPSPTSLHLRVGRPLSFRSLQRHRQALATATNLPLLLHCSQIHLASLIASPLRTA
jgi:hypothetical protein